MANKKSFSSMTNEEKKLIESKMFFLIAHLDLVVELSDELEFVPSVWRHKFKQKGVDFRKEALKFLDEVLGLSCKVGTPSYDLDGNQVGTTDDIQEQAWPLINRIKQMNQEAIIEFSQIINEE